jgi:hypothetical protein
LRHVGNSGPLEERDRLRFVAGLHGAAAFILRREAVCVDDGRIAFALAHMPIEAERLAKGQPTLACKAMLNDGAAQNEDVDSA